ncbi:MAG: energy transducer TonB, partial [Myxococcota bacterium]|nr:energy transducer TonB [Myxococcota bacterium]MEC8381423.1 energy transducer TonB [Myxococcota bacterium]
MSASPSEPLVDFENRTAPVLLEMIQPDYPEEAGNAHGDVTVLLQISEAGFVVGIKVISGPEVFYEPARTASKKLKFEPALKNNEP